MLKNYAVASGFGAAIAFGAALGVGAAWMMAVHSESIRYRAAGEEAKRFARAMGVVHGGCANQACSGLLNGKPVTYFCQPSGCSFDREEK